MFYKYLLRLTAIVVAISLVPATLFATELPDNTEKSIQSEIVPMSSGSESSSENGDSSLRPGTSDASDASGQIGSGNDSEAGSNSGSGSSSETGSNIGSGSSSETGSNSGSGSSSETGNDSGSGSNSETGSDAGNAGSDSNTGSNSGSSGIIGNIGVGDNGSGNGEAATEGSETGETIKRTNEELLAEQHLVIPAVKPVEKVDDWRDQAMFRWDPECEEIYLPEGVTVFEAADMESRIIASSHLGSLGYLLQEEGEWSYIESDAVRGFVKTDELVRGNAFYEMFPLGILGSVIEEGDSESADGAAYSEPMEQADLPEQSEEETETLPMILCDEMKVMVEPCENQALTYLMVSGYNPMPQNAPVWQAQTDVTIYQAKELTVDESGAITTPVAGTLCKDGIAWILADEEDEMVYVESGEVRGFAEANAFLLADDMILDESDIGRKAEVDQLRLQTEELAVAAPVGNPLENAALYYTIKTTHVICDPVRVQDLLIEFACQFVGNPYVWGGTSLTNGADCSGFVQQVFAKFGYQLPRTSAEQSVCNMQIPLECAMPGDLIFFATDGVVNHVAIYMGDGQTVQAANSKAGIIKTGVGSKAVWAVRILPY